MNSQVADLEDHDNEWSVDKIINYQGKGEDAIFETVWKSEDHTWIPFETASQLTALNAYFDALGIEDVAKLSEGQGMLLSDPQVFLRAMHMLPAHHQAIK